MTGTFVDRPIYIDRNLIKVEYFSKEHNRNIIEYYAVSDKTEDNMLMYESNSSYLGNETKMTLLGNVKVEIEDESS